MNSKATLSRPCSPRPISRIDVDEIERVTVKRDATLLVKAHNIAEVRATGTISGEFHVAGHIDKVRSRKDISATMNASSISSIRADGSVNGEFNAATEIGQIRAGDDITANITAPHTKKVHANDEIIGGVWETVVSKLSADHVSGLSLDGTAVGTISGQTFSSIGNGQFTTIVSFGAGASTVDIDSVTVLPVSDPSADDSVADRTPSMHDSASDLSDNLPKDSGGVDSPIVLDPSVLVDINAELSGQVPILDFGFDNGFDIDFGLQEVDLIQFDFNDAIFSPSIEVVPQFDSIQFDFGSLFGGFFIF